MRRAPALGALCLLLAASGASAPPKLSRPRTSHGQSASTAASGIPRSLLAGMRPIGRGPRFQPPAGDRFPGACTTQLGGRQQAHIELFGANRVVLLATGIGTRAPRKIRDGRLTHARCFGDVVTLDPTGTVYFRAGEKLTVGNLFALWGQRLGTGRIASFTGGRVRVYIDGRRSSISPRAVPLTEHAEIVLEVGPRVPPHVRFSFPRLPPPGLR